MTPSYSPTNVITPWLNSHQTVALEEVMQALLELERAANKQPNSPTINDFIGSWRLRFIGKKQSLNASQGQLKGSGKQLPPWLKIRLTYQTRDPSGETEIDVQLPQGCILNQVQVGPFILELSGPWCYHSTARIMAFDFLHLNLVFWGRSLLSIPVRGGKTSEAQFWKQPLKEKAFFKYFWVTSNAIAARGKGGGIALWEKVESNA